jgi:hypothetical protein
MSLRHGLGFHERRVGTVIRLGQSEARAEPPVEQVVAVTLVLIGRRELFEHHDERVVADDRVFRLQIVEESEAFCGEVFADDGHPKVRTAFAAMFFRPCEAQMTGFVGDRARFGEQCLPVLARQTVVVPVGARMFAAMIEEPDVIVAVLDRHDLLFDELIEFVEIVLQFFRNLEVHGVSLLGL